MAKNKTIKIKENIVYRLKKKDSLKKQPKQT